MRVPCALKSRIGTSNVHRAEWAAVAWTVRPQTHEPGAPVLVFIFIVLHSPLCQPSTPFDLWLIFISLTPRSRLLCSLQHVSTHMFLSHNLLQNHWRPYTERYCMYCIAYHWRIIEDYLLTILHIEHLSFCVSFFNEGKKCRNVRISHSSLVWCCIWWFYCLSPRLIFLWFLHLQSWKFIYIVY